MEIDVGGGEEQGVMDNVETVEVVASGDDVSIPSSSAAEGLMDQPIIVANPESILVPTSVVSKNPSNPASLVPLQSAV